MDVDDDDEAMDENPGPPTGAATKRGIDEAYGAGNHIVVKGNKMYIAGTRNVNDAVNEDVHAVIWGAKTTELMRQAEDVLSRHEEVKYVTGHSLGALVADALGQDHKHLTSLAIAPPTETAGPAIRSEGDIISVLAPAEASPSLGWNTHAMENMDESLIERGWAKAVSQKRGPRPRSSTPGPRNRRWTVTTPSTAKTRKGSRPPKVRPPEEALEEAAAVTVPEDEDTKMVRYHRRRESSARREIADVVRGPRARSQVRGEGDTDVSDAFRKDWTRMASPTTPGASSSFEAPGGGGFG